MLKTLISSNKRISIMIMNNNYPKRLSSSSLVLLHKKIIINNNNNNIIKIKRKLSSLSGMNPMYPGNYEKPLLIDPLKDNNKDNNKDESLLSKYSNKIGIVAFTLAIILIYSYIKSNQNQKNEETIINNKYHSITITEYNDIKYSNNINSIIFDDIINYCNKKYNNNNIIYNIISNDIKLLLKNKYNIIINNGYLIDRIIINNNIYNNNNNISLIYFLIVLNIIVNDNNNIKLKNLYNIYINNNKNIIDIIDSLLNSSQIPAEKQVIYTGKRNPAKIYDRKNSNDIINSYINDNKNININNMNEDEFINFLTSKYVCIWGECYR